MPRDQDTKFIEAPAGAPRLIVTERFGFALVEMGLEGATLRVRPLPRRELDEVVRANAIVFAMRNDKMASRFAEDLEVEYKGVPRLVKGGRLLVGEMMDWKTIHWFLVEHLADADGCLP